MLVGAVAGLILASACCASGQTNDPGVPLAVQNIRRAVAAWQAAHAANAASNMQTMDSSWPFPSGGPGPGGGGGDPPPPYPQPDYGTNLFLVLLRATSTNPGVLLLTNTVPGTPYEIIGSPALNVPLSNWMSFGLWLAETNSINISVVLGTNDSFFFDAHAWSFAGFTNHPSTNGQILLVVSPSHTNAAGVEVSAMINGSPNNLTAVYSNYILLEPPLYSLNLGYGANDTGNSNGTTCSLWPEQEIQAVYGYSLTLTNLLLSTNPLSRLDVHGFPSLQDLECWHCSNLFQVNITNCPSLTRVCFESANLEGTLDVSGDTYLAELRAAFNHLSNIVFNGAGPNIWHLCAHNNPFTNQFDFTQFPKLSELWMWDTAQSGALVLTNLSTLTSVQMGNSGGTNNFTTANFQGCSDLWDIELDNNPLLASLNVAGCGRGTNLANNIIAEYCDLPPSVEDSVMSYLDSTGVRDGTVDFYGANNATLDVAGLTAMHSLTNKGWTVFWLGRPTGTPVITGVGSSPSSNTSVITWTTDRPSDSTVYYGTNTAYGSLVYGGSSVTSHAITLTNLAGNTPYHFYVASTTNALTGISWDYQFLTFGPPNTNPIYFVSTSQTNTMVAVSGSATLLWQWGDGTTDTNAVVTHTFTNAAGPWVYTNSLLVSSANALTGFGVGCQTNAWTNTLSSVWGLTNCPNLEALFFYQSGLSNLSLAGCSNLDYVALVGTSPTTATEDQWFIDLDEAEAGQPTGSLSFCSDSPLHFFYPTNPGPTSASYSNRLDLASKHWTLVGD